MASKAQQPFAARPFSARAPGESLKLINDNMSPEDRQRHRTRRAIEDLEEAIRLRREDDALREGDW